MSTSDTKRLSGDELNHGVGRAKVLHARDAASFVGLSESTLAKLRLNGNGPVYCKLGRRVVYRLGDLSNGYSRAPRATRRTPMRGS